MTLHYVVLLDPKVKISTISLGHVKDHHNGKPAAAACKFDRCRRAILKLQQAVGSGATFPTSEALWSNAFMLYGKLSNFHENASCWRALAAMLQSAVSIHVASSRICLDLDDR